MEAIADRFGTFFTQYRQFISEHEANSIARQEASFQKLFDGYKSLKPELEKINQAEAEYFNIFKVMKLGHLEVRAHTPVLAHLLDPRGTHAQLDLYYRLFVDMVLQEDLFRNYEPARIEVRTELGTQYGQIDIIIIHHAISNPYAIVIENKIYAGDQKDQLVRYKKYLDSLHNIPASAKRMLYLKPMQTRPSEYSVNAITLTEWTDSGFIKNISYKDEILPWLNAGLNEIKADKVKVLVKQYIQLLQTICHE